MPTFQKQLNHSIKSTAMPDLLLQNFIPDWELLRNQKDTLLDMTINEQDIEKLENIEGIIALINFIQDNAVESGIWTELEVFGSEQDTDLTEEFYSE